MTCQARAISPGLGVYVRTALVSSSSSGWLVGSPHRVRETVQHARHQPAYAPAGHDTSRRPATFPRRRGGAGRDATGPSPCCVRSAVRPVVRHRGERVDLALAVPGRVAAVALALLRSAALRATDLPVV